MSQAQPEIDQQIRPILEEWLNEPGNDTYTQICREALLDSAVKPFFLPRLVLLVAKAANPQFNTEEKLDQVYRFAALSHILDVASSIFDDVIDDDKVASLPGKYGARSGLLVGLGLWFMAERELLRITHKIKDEVASELVQVTYTGFINAARGQFLELHNQQLVSVEQGLEWIFLKAGLLIQEICRFAAYLAGADPATCSRYATFGMKFGVLCQLRNDLKSIYDPDPARNSLVQKQFTLPVLYLQTLAGASSNEAVEIISSWQVKDLASDQIKPLVEQLEQGGVQLTMLHLQQLHQQIKQLLTPPSGADKALLSLVENLLF